MIYPQRPESHQLEELSKRFFMQCLPKNWCAEKPASDYGVDLKVDIFEESHASGLELLVQLKSSQATISSKDYETISIEISTYNHLRDKLQVVLLVKYIESENEAFWVLLYDVPEPNQSQKTFTIRIPKRNRLSSIDWNQIQEYVREVTRGKLESRRRRRL